jgi:hypothetical protein
MLWLGFDLGSAKTKIAELAEGSRLLRKLCEPTSSSHDGVTTRRGSLPASAIAALVRHGNRLGVPDATRLWEVPP